MLSLSRMSLLLPVILCTVLHTQCSEFNGTPKRTITINIDEIPQKDNSPLYELGKILLPVAGGALINYAIQKYTEDPEVASINKELKKIELETKQHPDYPIINLQLKKNKAEEQNLINKEKQLELEIKNAQLMQHYEEKLDHFRKCDKPLTQDFCNNMTKMYQEKLEAFTQQRS